MTMPSDPGGGGGYQPPMQGWSVPNQYPPPSQYPPVEYPESYPPPYPPPPYPPYPDPYGPYASGKPPGINGMAIAALVTALAGPLLCGAPSIVAVVLGIVAMRDTRRTGQDGYGMALAGVIIGTIVVFLGAIVAVIWFAGMMSMGLNQPTY